MRRRPDFHAIAATSSRRRHRADKTKAPHKTRKADLERRAICSLLGAVDADLDGLAEHGPDLQVHPRQRGRLERRRGVAEERGQPVQRYCFGDCSSACGVDFCVDYCFDFSSGDCCHLSALALCLLKPLKPLRVLFFSGALRGVAVGCLLRLLCCFGRKGGDVTWAATIKCGQFAKSQKYGFTDKQFI